MKIVIRADASLQIGTGHIMRCLTLAHELKLKGGDISFLCRAHEGNLNQKIRQEGFSVIELPLVNKVNDSGKSSLRHAAWLGATQEEDASICLPILQSLKPDWLIVDHYALDLSWEKALKQSYEKLMIIDDLGDREHCCDLLLDQTYGRNEQDYKHLIPGNCKMLLGTKYALLRPEFSHWREKSLKRRIKPNLGNILISMGGVDVDNVTGQVLKAIKKVNLPKDIRIITVLGRTAPHLNEVKCQVKNMPFNTEVIVDVHNMAEIMTNSDLAIGAAGATTWERCCLGLPTIMITLADNQNFAAAKLEKSKIAWLISSPNKIRDVLSDIKENPSSSLLNTSLAARSIADGKGVMRVVAYMD